MSLELFTSRLWLKVDTARMRSPLVLADTELHRRDIFYPRT